MLILIDLGIPLILGIIVITQILIPTWQNRPMFPVFRKERKLKAAITELEQCKVEDQLSIELESSTQKLLSEIRRRKEEQVKKFH